MREAGSSKAKAIVCLIGGLLGIISCIVVLALGSGRADMMFPWQEYDTTDVIAVYRLGTKLMGGMFAGGFLSGMLMLTGIQEMGKLLRK